MRQKNGNQPFRNDFGMVIQFQNPGQQNDRKHVSEHWSPLARKLTANISITLKKNPCTKSMEIHLSEMIPTWLSNFKIWINKMIQSMCRNTRRLYGAKIDGKPLHNHQNHNLYTKSMCFDVSGIISAWLIICF